MATEICATAPYYDQVLKARAEWETYAETLPEEERLQCKKMMNELVSHTLQAIKDFYFSGATCDQLQKQAGRLVFQLNHSAFNVCEGHTKYEEKKVALDKAMNKIDLDAKNTLPPSNYKPGRLSEPKSLHQISLEHKEDHGHSSDISVRGAELAQGKFIHSLEHLKGKTPAIFLEFAIESVKNYMFGSESENKVRDSAASAAGHISMVETVSLVVPHRIPVGIAVTGVHLSGDVAQAMLPIAQKRLETLTNLIEQLCTQETNQDCLNARWERVRAEESVLVLEGLKLSSKAIHTVHHAATDIIKGACDEVGLTDKNVSNTFKKWSKNMAAAAERGIPIMVGRIP